jgi:hypothetical protein
MSVTTDPSTPFFTPKPAPQGVGPSAFPLVLSPTSPAELSLSNLISEAERLGKTGDIQIVLNRHGAIHFKDIGLKDASEFSQFARAFGWVPHEDIGNPVRRTVLADNVATANEGPNTQPVYPHNEFGLSSHYPAYIFFYCASAPDTGMVGLCHSLLKGHDL